MLLTIVFALFGVLIISLIVFGGGQVFLPLFRSLWDLLSDTFHLNLDNDLYQNIFTVVNSTPGVVSTKLAAITGLIISQGEWWGFLVLLLTYVIFVLPAILVMYFGNILLKKIINKYLNKSVMIFKPIIAGILISLAFQLLLSTLFFNVDFNHNYKEYIAYNTTSGRNNFFKGWRLYVLYTWLPIEILISIYLHIKKINLFFIIILMIILSLIFFQPWLT